MHGATRPRLLIVAGPNGAGKTTVTDAGLAHQWFAGCEYINPDLIAQRELGDWNDPKAVLEAAQLATARREACLREGRSLAFETVFSAPDKVNFVRRGIASSRYGRRRRVDVSLGLRRHHAEQIPWGGKRVVTSGALSPCSLRRRCPTGG